MDENQGPEKGGRKMAKITEILASALSVFASKTHSILHIGFPARHGRTPALPPTITEHLA